MWDRWTHKDDDCLQELRWIYDRRDIQEAQQDLASCD
jgi:transposase-like protein